MSRQQVGLAAGAALFALAVLLLRSWRIDFPYSIDFQTYWLAGSRVMHGEASKLYEPGGGEAEGLPADLGPSEFKNMPIVAVAFAPFSAASYPAAKRAFWWFSVGAICATAWVVGRYLVPEAVGPVAARCLGAFAVIAVMAPTHTALRHGQTTPWVALLVATWWALVSRRPMWAGVALAGACLIKFPPFALLALDALRARWRVVTTCLGALAGVGLVSLALFGPELHRIYASGVLEQSGQVMTGHNNQSLTATVTRVFEPVPLNDWTPRPAPAAATWAMRFVALMLAVAAGFHIRKVRDPSFARLPYEGLAASALGIVLLPVAWDHYFLLMAPGMIAGGAALMVRGERGLLFGLGAAYVLIGVPTPPAWLERASTTGAVDGLLVSHYFVGAVAAIVVALLALRRS